MSKYEELSLAVEKGKKKLIDELVQGVLAEGVEPTVILDECLIGAMGRVGESFSRGEIFVPEMLLAARAMKAGVDALKPYLASGAEGAMGKCLIGTVEGDLHDIGKNLVVMMLESAGFEVIDLGVDIPEDRFIEAYGENPDTKIIALSALLTTTMPAMESAVAKLNAAPFRSKIKVMVGGAPIDEKFAEQIGADGYAVDAATAADKAKELVS